MLYLVDSDTVIDHLVFEPEVVELVSRLAPSGLAMSVVSYMEAYQGIGRAPDPVSAEATLDAFVAIAPILPLSVEVARRCARLRENLRQQGRRVNSRALDLIIAATAIEHGLILVPRNVRDDRDLPELQLYQPT